MITPPAPFFNSAIDVYSYATDVLLVPDPTKCMAVQSQMKQIASVLASCNNKLALNTYNDILKDSLEAAITSLNAKDITKSQQECLCTIFQQVLALSNDAKIKARLLAAKTPIRLLKALKEDNPKEAGRIIRDLKPVLKQPIIEIILQLSAGCQETERELANEVYNYLKEMKTFSDSFFIETVFSSLLHNEVRRPVCFKLRAINPKNGEVHYEPSFDELTDVPQAPKTKQDNTANFLPTTLLDSEQKKSFVKAFKHIVGKQSQ